MRKLPRGERQHRLHQVWFARARGYGRDFTLLVHEIKKSSKENIDRKATAQEKT